MRKILLISFLLISASLFAEPIKVEENKPVKFTELYGYFVFNHNLAYNLDMSGNNPYFNSPLSTPNDTLAWSTIKLHLEPVINVSETMEVHTKLSLFGDRILGTDNRETEIRENTMLVSEQERKRDDSNPLVFEGLWGSMDTALGEFRVGRMPFHWGLGILYNDANKLDSYYRGDFVDRLALVIPVSDFRLIPAFDINAEGPMTEYNANASSTRRLIDATQRDDAWSLSGMFVKKEEDPEILKEKIAKEVTFWELGTLVSYNWRKSVAAEKRVENEGTQDEKTTYYPVYGNIADSSKSYTSLPVDAKMWVLDLWYNYYFKNITIKAEGALIKGKIGRYKEVTPDYSVDKAVNAEMFGLATETEIRFMPNTFHLKLYAGLASNDNADRVMADSLNMPGNSINNMAKTDYDVKNFRFNPNYSFNSLIWKEVLGRFTSGFYTSVEAKYFFTEDLDLRSGLTYSRAWKEKNTIGGEGSDIAIEPFLSLEYRNKEGLRAGIDYQFAIPLSGLKEGNKSSFLYMLHSFVGFVF